MTTEANAAPDAAAQIPASDSANQTPEVAAPESNANESADGTANANTGDDAEKGLKRLQRRIDRVTASKYQAEAEARQLREQLARYESQQTPEGEQQAPSREDIDRYVADQADTLAARRDVDRRGAEISTELAKLAGSREAVSEIVAAVTEEAGPLIDSKGRWTPLGEAVDASDNPAALLMYLEKNDEAAASLRGLSAARLGRRIASIEADMAKAKAPQASKAPKPLDTVKPGASSSSNGEPNPKDTKAWIEWANKQDRMKRTNFSSTSKG